MNLDDESLIPEFQMIEGGLEPEDIFSFPSFDEIQPDLISQKSVKEKSIYWEQLQISSNLILSSKPPLQKRKSRPIFPNLLKNIITILKVWMKTLNSTNQDAQNLWNYFMDSNKINHQLIKTVFGTVNQTLEQSEQFISQDLSEHLSKIKPQNLIAAQQQIRQQTIKRINEADIRYIIKNRRVRNPQYFLNCFTTFISELEKGGVSKSFKISKIIEQVSKQETVKTIIQTQQNKI